MMQYALKRMRSTKDPEIMAEAMIAKVSWNAAKTRAGRPESPHIFMSRSIQRL